jgi:hypothetical protein
MKTVDRRLNRMIEIADELEIQLDQVVEHMGRSSGHRYRELSSNPRRLLAIVDPSRDALKSEVIPCRGGPKFGASSS